MRRLILFLVLLGVVLFAGGRVSEAKQMKDMDVDVSGVLQAGYSWSEIANTNDQFDISRMRLRLKGSVNADVSYFTELELAGNTSSSYAPAAIPSGTPASNLNLSNAAGSRLAQKDMGADSRLVMAYVDLNYWGKTTILKTIRIGQMPRGSNYELAIPVDQLETINYSTNVGQFGKYVRGVQFKLKPYRWMSLGIGIDNGNGGITGTDGALDDSTSWGVKATFFPKDYMQIKAFFRNVNKSEWMPDAQCYGGGMIYKYAGFNFMSEYYGCNPDPLNDGTKSTVEADITSWFMHVSYIIPDTKLQLVARYNEFEKEVSSRTTGAQVSDYDLQITTLGFNWMFDKNTRLQVMREMIDGEDNDSTDVQLQIKF